jgi:hypothetical protein
MIVERLRLGLKQVNGTGSVGIIASMSRIVVV